MIISKKISIEPSPRQAAGNALASAVQNNYLIILLITLSGILIAGCQTYKYESRILKHLEDKGGQYNVSAAEMRLQIDDLAVVFTGSIEQAADHVLSVSADNKIRRHALLWKINAIPIALEALFQSDPVMGFIDTWAFSMQMVDYFENGPGKDDFGQWHRIAFEASAKLETVVRELVTNIRTDGNINPMQIRINTWVKNHPIARDFVYRPTTIAIMKTLVGEKEMGALQSVGGLAVSMNDIAENIIVYMNLLTKQARWQAELVMTGSDDKQGIQDGLVSLNELGDFVNNIAPIVEQMPDLVARERETLLETLQRERIEVLANINQQRIDTLTYLKSVQLAVSDDLTSERHAIMDILQSEREVVLKSIDEQRNATLIEIESIGDRIVKETLKQSTQLIDHFLSELYSFSQLSCFVALL